MKNKWIIYGIGILLLLLLPQIFTTSYSRVLFDQIGINLILVISLNIVLGFTGQISFATAAFFGIGAYASSLLTIRLGFPFWVAFPISGIITTLFGVILGFPSLRVKGHYLAIITIGFGEILRLIMTNFKTLTNGPNGITNIPAPSIFGFSLNQPETYYYLVLAIVTLAMISTSRLGSSKIGRALKAIRDSSIAADCMGINTTYYKVLAFALSAFWAGIAGSLYAHLMSYIAPDVFVFATSVKTLIMLYIGGVGTMFGPVIGAVLITTLPEFLRFMENYYMALYGLGVLLIMIFMRGGIMGGLTYIKEKIFMDDGKKGGLTHLIIKGGKRNDAI
ncbi:branched-chain amino acid ABC transporter permease [Desulfitobacterium sp. AusDCA]|uniref:branched-chain amino acid ABC transporter permease n=1 Tax=Desulfitobacterium sp. AusDCA TaxID=3240383 RepID=UPI003DA6DB41